MTAFLERRARASVAAVARLVAAARRRSVTFGLLWRRSLQLRVVVSTLALGSAVIFVLGMVLQSQITLQLVAVKESAASQQTRNLAQTAERELAGLTPTTSDLGSKLQSALNKLTSSAPDESGGSTGSAGAFEPVLASHAADGTVAKAGTYEDVPEEMRRFVRNAQGQIIGQNHTVMRDGAPVTYLIMGTTVTSSPPSVQLYMLYPLDSEQSTVNVVQNTLIVGGLVLLALLAGITNLVTRQVVMPVRRAARAAERFADGELDERMVVVGEDDVARLAQSYNEMAESIERQIRQLEEFGQLQRRFTSDVSHELRTPLTTVRMAADVLHASRKQFPAGLARSTELLVDELDRFETLLADLLEISRLDAGVEELVADETDLRDIVRRAVDSVRVIARNTGTELVLDLPDERVVAEVEPRRIERILRNLLGNAVDHADGKPVELRMAADDDAVAVTVRDHGVGLRPGEAELVFNRFWRADASRNRQTGGTGLGLAISLEDARLHGGGLDAWGEPGEGACFRLTVPRRQGGEYARSPLPLPPAEAPVVEEALP
ncbi:MULTISPECIES: MtrAB system histidine kinase MtrB [Actinokineospora]|uniref:Sensor histidine kinase MtrB n=1 Tax=Actinokineospora fastidiosa TaxID=1816 RepID=A0A918G9C7_9PSEU|nr:MULTISPECIES: MtrAB system histidine kinase MtrB [Actinokineospora]UVS81737.1 Sensor histidine kinase MtrB [Actinokineospora sp. UTMC 2448]GGS25657.1 two-component sensor histidine kinase [Actinokineospora fastidiosa]